MSIITVIPIFHRSEPEKSVHEFVANTSQGKSVRISVEAEPGANREAVMKDLRENGLADISPADEKLTLFACLFGVGVFWVFALLFGLMLAILLDIADVIELIPSYGSVHFKWPITWPIVGDTAFWVGMLRLWLIALPSFILAGIAVWFSTKRSEARK